MLPICPKSQPANLPDEVRNIMILKYEHRYGMMFTAAIHVMIPHYFQVVCPKKRGCSAKGVNLVISSFEIRHIYK